MMALANVEPMPRWRNFGAWSLVGAVFVLATWGGILFMYGGGINATFPSGKVAASLALALLLAMAVTGFTGRKRAVSVRSLRNYIILNAMAFALFLAASWGLGLLGGAGTLGLMTTSKWAAAVTGLVLVGVALLGMLATASAHTGADLIDDEMAAEDMRERGRMIFYGLAWMALSGLCLLLLALAGPGGVLSPAFALAAALILIAVLIFLGIATWRLSDELVRTLSYETGNMAFYLILGLGGGWAMLAHLGFVAGPEPLDWLTMSIVLLYVASFVVLGRRKLFTR